MKKLLPILIIVIGIAAGAGAGMFLKPAPVSDPVSNHADNGSTEQDEKAERSFVKIGKQTIVPVVNDGETRALMLFELAVDVPATRVDQVHEMEPRLRDAFLRELFQMSYTGAFLTNFTEERVIEELRRNLTNAARTYLGHNQAEVLILDVMRQEM